jgi:hypothetical protein
VESESGEETEGKYEPGGHIPIILSQVVSLQELHLDFRENSDPVLRRPGQLSSVWTNISQVILKKFAHLQKIVVSLPDEDIEEATYLIKKELAAIDDCVYCIGQHISLHYKPDL